jgi:hypothetical protein
MHAVSPLSRFVAGPAARRTVLLDEIDTILGLNAGEHKEQRPAVGGSAPASAGFSPGVAYVLVKVAKGGTRPQIPAGHPTKKSSSRPAWASARASHWQ